MVGWLKWAVTALLSVGGVIGSHMQLTRVPPPVVDVNMLFVPPETLTRVMAAGNENLVADGLWLGLLQYYGERVVADDRRSVNLVPMFDLITDLDPQFWYAYWLGSWAMLDNDEVDAAIALMAKGAKKNPGDYNYPYTEGYLRYLGKGDYAGAAQSFEKAAGMPGAPRFARTMAARMYETQGHDKLAYQIWRTLADNPASDAHTRRIAQRNVERIEAQLAGHAESAFRKQKSDAGVSGASGP